MILLRARGVCQEYVRAGVCTSVLLGVNLEVRAGEHIAIMGASGSGKSTLLFALGGLEPVTAGEVAVGEELIPYAQMRDIAQFRNRTLGFVFQFSYLIPELSAVENVMIPALIAGVKKKDAQRHATDLLACVGLSERLHHRPATLSGGEQQRVAIARALSMHPRILLADEMTGNLDAKNRMIVLDLVLQLCRQMGSALVLVTHDREVAARLHTTYLLCDGILKKD